MNLPLSELEQRASELAPGKTYIVYCASGQRSAQAQEIVICHWVYGCLGWSTLELEAESGDGIGSLVFLGGGVGKQVGSAAWASQIETS